MYFIGFSLKIDKEDRHRFQFQPSLQKITISKEKINEDVYNHVVECESIEKLKERIIYLLISYKCDREGMKDRLYWQLKIVGAI